MSSFNPDKITNPRHNFKGMVRAGSYGSLPNVKNGKNVKKFLKAKM